MTTLLLLTLNLFTAIVALGVLREIQSSRSYRKHALDRMEDQLTVDLYRALSRHNGVVAVERNGEDQAAKNGGNKLEHRVHLLSRNGK